MEVACPIDARFPDEISSLLKPLPPRQVQEYFDHLVKARECRGLVVKQDGQHGKGVYADVDFKEGGLVLKDQMLAGAQHFANKFDCLVCGFCFRFIGSIELQIGRKLCFQDLGVSANNECDGQTFLHMPEEKHKVDSSNGEDDLYKEDSRGLGECASSSSKYQTPLSEGVAQSLMNGELVLPYSDKFPLPEVIFCPGGCREAFYCSKFCADADWDMFHSLLCVGSNSKSSNKGALQKFMRHANETNDIFLLAAKVVAFVILRYKKLKAADLDKQEKCTGSCDLSLLLEAWKPVAMGYKRRWWECIALPDDIDCCDESEFRMQIKELAFTSLQLLKAAIFDEECEPLFSLEIYGHIIGMFELNNLDLVVASPVEDYFLYIDDLQRSEKKQAERITGPLLDALGHDYSVHCEGPGWPSNNNCSPTY
ncbi:histone-lysine N-methyltransferase ATXR2 isoform X2 [Diospyros lotus]|uniref:histone-lysine N-methyltransferase ATXR2 isoform X2 n=1 Tax=Diospyros lotus TaxID=55363 RepID=UPI002250B0BD|nr:histone-lysine N-methyltransferase ATXR2 isoform X2 [Diospyros lotus]